MGTTAGQWLEKALSELSKKRDTALSLDLDAEIISGLISYCELAQPLDAKEYLDNIIGQEAGKTVIEEYLRRRGFSGAGNSTATLGTSEFHAYVKPATEDDSVNRSKKPPKLPKDVRSVGNEVTGHGDREKKVFSNTPELNQKANQGNPKKKKAVKVVSLAEAAKGAVVFKKGIPCSCQARRHKLVSNCLSCGKIVCEQEGEGPCNFCGALVLKEGSSYAGLEESLAPLSDAEAAAEAFTKRLIDYDRNSAARTTVIDDQSDYYEFDSNSWISKEEKELIRKKREEIEEAEKAKRNRVVVTFDLVGRKVVLNQDEISELELENRILRPPDETKKELNRIKPNPTIRIQPVFIDPGTTKKPVKGKQSSKTLSNGLCLEITGRVQHDRNELKNLMMDSQNASDGNSLQDPSANSGLHVEDDDECSLDYD